MKQPLKILVTGGGGFLGGAIVRRLVARGDHVRSFSRNFYPVLETLGVEQHQGDLVDQEAVVQACRDVDLVLHVAAKAGVWGRYHDFYQTNVIGTRHVIAGCRLQKTTRLVYTSSPSVIFDGRDNEGVDESAPYAAHFKAHYPKTKALAEQAVLQAAGQGLPAIVLRPHLIWGPGDNHLVPRIIARAKRLKKIGPGDNLVDTTYIDNAAQAHILAADKLNQNPGLSGNVYFISQNDPIPLWRMIDAILKTAGLGPVKGSVSKKTAWLAGAVFEGIYMILQLDREPPLTRFVAEELASAHWFDITAAKRDLGYVPAVSIQEGLKHLAAWLDSGSGL